MTDFISKMPIEEPEDVFALRQSGREAAAALGCDRADQVRMATALSELGREILAHGAAASAQIALDFDVLVIDIVGFPRTAMGDEHAGGGLDAARKLVEGLVVIDAADSHSVTVRLRRAPPHRDRAVGVEVLRAAVARSAPLRPLDELRLENRDLISTLERLESQQTELVRLNAELEETNRGVMAIFRAAQTARPRRGLRPRTLALGQRLTRSRQSRIGQTRTGSRLRRFQ